ncbi:MAG: YlxR family protein [Ilumatobacter sp.]|nr:YlxR family protein [Ilumatobacter sp.]
MRRRPEASEPVRSCIGCRTRRPQSALVRITRSAHGVTFDGASDGRGAWLCRSATGAVAGACLDTALAKRAFDRAWRSRLGTAEMADIRERSGVAHV